MKLSFSTLACPHWSWETVIWQAKAIRDLDTTKPLLDELQEANRIYLPQFFG
jgi:hypothetical protein